MATRVRILTRDQSLCQCGECCDLTADEVDHITPLWEGGEDNDSNLQALNAECHKRKTALEAARRSAAALSVPEASDSPLGFLIGVMNDAAQDPRLRVRAAIAAAQYKHAKIADGGKKDEKQRAAKTAGSGKFAPTAPPMLVVNNR